MLRLLVLACACLCTSAAVAAPQTLLTAASIRTSDPARPQATALVWDESGRLLDVGDAAALRGKYPQAERIDAGQATVIPGLIDAHGHVMGLGYALMRADLVGAQDKAEVVRRLRAYAATLPADAWLLGTGWDQNDWPEKTFPTAADLDAAFPDRPVWLERVDGHAGWVNSAALKRVQAKASRPLAGDWQPDGGRIERSGGQPTGVFVDDAMSLVQVVLPVPDEAYRREALQRALAAMARDGLTGAHDMGTSREDLATMARFADEGRLTARIDAYADGGSDALADRCRDGAYAHPSGRLEMKGVKLFMDGALGSRGAALLADYSDDHGNRGLLVTDPKRYGELVAQAKACHLQVATHAIGDRANRVVLEVYAAALGGKNDKRFRIEHAQVVSLPDFQRFADYSVIASMQATHATSDMRWAERRLGPDRVAGAYAWQRFLKIGVPVANGSDFPVEEANPMLGLYAAVTRQDLKGQPAGGWMPDQRMSRDEALRTWTLAGAYAAFEERIKGSIEPGKLADFLILDRDIMLVPERDIAAANVRVTVLGGRVVHELK